MGTVEAGSLSVPIGQTGLDAVLVAAPQSGRQKVGTREGACCRERVLHGAERGVGGGGQLTQYMRQPPQQPRGTGLSGGRVPGGCVGSWRRRQPLKPASLKEPGPCCSYVRAACTMVES